MKDIKVSKFRRITQLFLLSLLGNLLLSFALMYMWKKRYSFRWAETLHLLPERVSSSHSLNSIQEEQVLSFLTLSHRQLCEKLENTTPIGYRCLERDLALSLLVDHHYFPLRRLFPHLSLQRREFLLSQSSQVLSLYTGLKDAHYQEIIHFLSVEQWPFTVKGLFLLCRQREGEIPLSLQQSFLALPPLPRLRALFPSSIEDRELLQLLLEGEWSWIKEFEKLQRTTIAIVESPEEQVHNWLLRTLSHHSSTAARLLLRIDHPFLLHSASLDLLHTLLEALSSLSLNLEEERLLRELQEFRAIDPLPAPSPSIPSEVTERTPQLYRVQEGDSLWKISRRINLPVEEIIRLNQLEGDRIFPGQQLLLPKVEEQ